MKWMFLLLGINWVFTMQAQDLFNEHDWNFYHVELKNNAKKAEVFTIGNGIITGKGKPAGYIRTFRKYNNYQLTLEWRWVDAPSNAGVLLNITGNDKVWPQNIEAQLKHGEAGDFIIVGSGSGGMHEQSMHSIKSDDVRKFKILESRKPSQEKTIGEWNKYDILVKNSKIVLKVNGVKMNEIERIIPGSGYIGLATLGTEIQFRNVIINPFD